MQISNLIINRIALHQIFERDENRNIVPPHYNSQLTNLVPDGKMALRNRIISALGNNSSSIQMNVVDVSPTSCFQTISDMIYLNDSDFLEKSKQIATKLSVCQSSRSIPGGIVVVLSGTVGNAALNYAAVIKAESQEGFALNSVEQNLELIFLNELLLTRQQKLYKIGIFIEQEQCVSGSTSPRNPDQFLSIVYDQNMNHAETRSAALYFYESFLGCAVHPSSKKLTSDFYNYTKDFINQLNIPDPQKVDLHNSLYDYLKVSREPVISVATFAERYFETEIIDEYSSFMRTKNFPANTIEKDTELVKSKLRKRRIKFTSDVQIIAPAENFNEIVQVVSQETESMTLRISGRVKEQ